MVKSSKSKVINADGNKEKDPRIRLSDGFKKVNITQSNFVSCQRSGWSADMLAEYEA